MVDSVFPFLGWSVCGSEWTIQTRTKRAHHDDLRGFLFSYSFSHRGTGGWFLGFSSGSWVLREEKVAAVLVIRVGYKGEGGINTTEETP